MLVELELTAAGRWVAEYYPCESVTELEEGRLRVVLRTPDTGWVRRLALRLGEDGRVISPRAAGGRGARGGRRRPRELCRIIGSYTQFGRANLRKLYPARGAV